ncbi:hypothetical protein PISMIDRAFT_689243 [Pisolithus microcarpus 441]|uniref:Uncharacterized protein n=1 Tax=Pisolithus microcarpus 441 TaxID=765257 RepID=A0A0C9Y736_9AGAM|nr:hypothetical protein BKA83DRAFT_689243 [Pisolithus microcarpus]KIK12761.1 hypothetical protein PISMIDRAFT_689243 [Pisolithus microcarpus 441]
MNVICRSQLHSILESWDPWDLGEATLSTNLQMGMDDARSSLFGLHVVERLGGGDVAVRGFLPGIYAFFQSRVGKSPQTGPQSCMPQRTDFSTATSATIITGKSQLDRICRMCSTIMQSYPSCSRAETGHTPLRSR